jgi:L-histidine N-alpha-methyltransferase
VARWDPDNEWVEMRLRAQVDQTVTLPALDMTVGFEAGEQMRTEISSKFRRAGVEAELGAAGFEPARFWTDAAGDFALSLSLVG